MKTQYLLTDKQKQRIHELNKKIFELEMEIASIYSLSNVRYITETEEEAERVKKYFCYGDKLLPRNCVVKIEKE